MLFWIHFTLSKHTLKKVFGFHMLHRPFVTQDHGNSERAGYRPLIIASAAFSKS